jgi:hypothetical protein
MLPTQYDAAIAAAQPLKRKFSQALVQIQAMALFVFSVSIGT